MKKKDLKQLIKPLVKECIHEVLLEEGLLSNVVAEVAKGMQGNLVVESKSAPDKRLVNESMTMQRKSNETREKLDTYRKGLLDAIGKDSYNGVDLFEGTAPLNESIPSPGHVDLGSPQDAGVDISSLLGNAPQVWKAMK